MVQDIKKYLSLLETQQLLLEFNVINVSDIEREVGKLSKDIVNQSARKWFDSAVRRFLINDPQSNVRISGISSAAPDWLRKRYEAGEELYHFHVARNVFDRLRHVIDWLNSLEQVSHQTPQASAADAKARQKLVVAAQKYLKGINTLDIKQLISPKQEKVRHHVEDWFHDLNELADVTEDVSGTKDNITYPNGYKWVEVFSAKALEREGNLMQHCVSGYYQRVKAKQCTIYSLRDPQNKPHCTIEVSNGEINQVKGKQNRAPVGKYLPYVQDFLNRLKIPANYYGQQDLEQMGLNYDDKTVQYGTIYDLAEKLDKTSGGLEFLKYQGKILIWYNNAVVADMSMHQDRGDPNKITVTISVQNLNDNALTNASMKQALYKEIIKFVNKTYKDKEITIGPYDSNNVYNYYQHEGELKQVGDFPVLVELAHSNVIAAGNYFWFVEKDNRSNVLFKMIKALYPHWLDDIALSVKQDIMDFLNMQNVDASARGFDPLGFSQWDIGYKDGKWMDIYQAANKFKEWKDGGIYGLQNWTRVLDNNQTILTITGTTFSPKIKIQDPAAVSRHATDIAEYLNQIKIYSSNVDKNDLTRLKNCNIIWKNGTWTVPKASTKIADPKGYNLVKVSAKQANITDPTGANVGTVSFASANEIEAVTLNDAESGEFLMRYSAANPKLKFLRIVNKVASGKGRTLSYSSNIGLWQLGFYVTDDDKLIKIRDFWPTKKIVESGTFTWLRRAYVFKNIEPSEFRYALQDAGSKTQMVIDTDKNKNIIKITPVVDTKAVDMNEENIVPYLDNINALIQALDLTVPGPMLGKIGLEFKDKKLQIPGVSSRLAQFARGQIAYEDGHVWLRDQYNKSHWKLLPSIENTYNEILSCRVVNGNIENIAFSTSRYRANKKLYREYLLDMMDIIDEME